MRHVVMSLLVVLSVTNIAAQTPQALSTFDAASVHV